MSRTRRNANNKNARRERHISIRAVRRQPPDLCKLSRAVIAQALAEAEAEAAAQATASVDRVSPDHTPLREVHDDE
ncbi:hypothetical protein [Rhodococcus aetherivorans]|uniref:hypothetical protein n=1 Tax=Rhodococcus aetherivorans TaxID=191292 RepID=UPI0009E4C0C7|nr:hypothetical protein [Rhodococcus aetherivorans]